MVRPIEVGTATKLSNKPLSLGKNLGLGGFFAFFPKLGSQLRSGNHILCDATEVGSTGIDVIATKCVNYTVAMGRTGTANRCHSGQRILLGTLAEKLVHQMD